MKLLLFALSLFSLSQAANLVRLTEMPPSVLGTYRLGAAGLLALIFAFWKTRTPWFIGAEKKAWSPTMLSAFFFWAHLWTYFFAAQNTEIAHAMILFSINPLFTALLAYWIFQEKLSLRLGIAYVFAMIGVLLLFQHKSSGFDSSWLGNLSALASGALYAAYLVSGKRARREVSNVKFTWTLYTTTSFFFFLSAEFFSFLGHDLNWSSYSKTQWLALGGTVLVPTLMGHTIFTYLLAHLNVNWMSTGKLVEPALSAMVAWLLFQEKISLETSLAFILTSFGVLFLIQEHRRLNPKS
jgi:drug/metabolite transporter (DMT)-like permease